MDGAQPIHDPPTLALKPSGVLPSPPPAPAAPPPEPFPGSAPLGGAPPIVPPAPAPPTPSGRKNTATLHLCAAAYLDRPFRESVIAQVYRRPDRAVAPNPGTDAVPILRHVLRARAIDLFQQALLAGLLALLVFAPVASKLGMVTGLLLWALVGQTALVCAAYANPGRAGSPRRQAKRLLIGTAVTGAVILGLHFLAQAIPDRIFVETGIEDYRSGGMIHETGYACLAVRTGERYDSFLGECIAYGSEFGFWPGFTGVVIWLIVLGAFTALFGAFRSRCLASLPSEPEPMAAANRRVLAIGQSQHSPVVLYNAARQPFVGSGRPIETWQFAMALRPAASAADAQDDSPIDPVGLNDHIRARLRQLGADSASTRRLPSLTISDRLYVSGEDTADLVRYPYELTRSGYPFQTMEQVQVEPTTPVRHYLRCEAASWDGELVVSAFAHFALQGESLYVEFTGCVLPPTRAQHQVFGYGMPSRKRIILGGSLREAATMPIALVRSPIDVLRTACTMLAQTRIGRARERRPQDHGAVVGIRELGARAFEQNYFQGRDQIKYLRIMERQILAALTEYLREHHIDTSELEERANAIVNNGVINYGKMQTGAAGAGSSAKVGSIGDNSRGSAA